MYYTELMTSIMNSSKTNFEQIIAYVQ